MSLCDPEAGMHHHFTGILPCHYFVPRPSCRFGEACETQHLSPMIENLDKYHETIAAIILEPVVQGAGGMYFYSPEYLIQLKTLCERYQILLIHDEIATGFGRTGKLFATEHANICPDIMCVGKGLTGGYMTLAATLCTETISNTISQRGPLMHGPTFMGNPLACAAANASLKLLEQNHWRQQVKFIEKHLIQGLSCCRSLSTVQDVRVLGAIGVIEMKNPVNISDIQPQFVKQGIWVRPFGKLIYLMPPYTINATEIDILCRGIFSVIKDM